MSMFQNKGSSAAAAPPQKFSPREMAPGRGQPHPVGPSGGGGLSQGKGGGSGGANGLGWLFGGSPQQYSPMAPMGPRPGAPPLQPRPMAQAKPPPGAPPLRPQPQQPSPATQPYAPGTLYGLHGNWGTNGIGVPEQSLPVPPQYQTPPAAAPLGRGQPHPLSNPILPVKPRQPIPAVTNWKTGSRGR